MYDASDAVTVGEDGGRPPETKLSYDTLCDLYGKQRVDAQVDLEIRMAGLGIEAFWRRVGDAKAHKRETGSPYGQRLLAGSVEKVAQGIEEFILEARTRSGPGRAHSAVPLLERLDPQVIALIALRRVIDGISTNRPMTVIAVSIGAAVEAETRMLALVEEHKGAAHRVSEKAKKATTDRHIHSVLRATMAWAGVEAPLWDNITKVHVGVKLLDIIIERTGLVQVVTERKPNGKSINRVTVTEKTAQWISRQEARCELLTPTHLPTLIQPAMWTTVDDGGYHTLAVPQLPLVKTHQRGFLEEMAERVDEMPAVFSTINALQNTAWKINKAVLQVAKKLWDRGISVAKLPGREDVKEVQCPQCGALVPLGDARQGRKGRHAGHKCFELNDEAKKIWKKRAAITHEENLKVRSKRILTQRTLWVAEMFEDEEEFFFPHQFDFRGRIYAVPQFSPQGHDLTRGLIEFANGKPITEENLGGFWLAVHGANVYGEDKISLQDRARWVEDRSEDICSVADDPMTALEFWTKADKPFQFLAFCFEWAEFQRVGWGFVSSLPVALDGSCSGIQHFSAMLRDGRGGEAVNLTPADVPSDIYAKVAAVVIEQLEYWANDCNKEEPWKAVWAQQLLDLGVDRKATKRQVMTMVYGATRDSCRKYTEEWLVSEKGGGPWEKDERFKVSAFLGKIIWDSIGEVVIAARQAMDWLQGCARIVSAEDRGISWTTPVGFVVSQQYPKLSSRRVETRLGDRVIKLHLGVENSSTGNRVDRRKAASAVSPNFVHSMDAAHLMMSVWYAKENGIQSFSMIHDSFGTHAADTDTLGACLREAFVDMYEGTDVLMKFRREILGQIEDPDGRTQVKPAPALGNLDLKEVLKSDFFFA